MFYIYNENIIGMAVRTGKPRKLDIVRVRRGTVLLVKSMDWWNRNSTYDREATCNVVYNDGFCCFIKSMTPWCGEEVTVRDVMYVNGYPVIRVYENEWNWVPEYFECIVQRENNRTWR